MKTTTEEDILEEALRITSGDRQNSYGPPNQDFTRTAALWSAIKGVEFTAQDVAMFMILLKLSRETYKSKRDNIVDACGYARCYWLCVEADEAKRAALGNHDSPPDTGHSGTSN